MAKVPKNKKPKSQSTNAKEAKRQQLFRKSTDKGGEGGTSGQWGGGATEGSESGPMVGTGNAHISGS